MRPPPSSSSPLAAPSRLPQAATNLLSLRLRLQLHPIQPATAVAMAAPMARSIPLDVEKYAIFTPVFLRPLLPPPFLIHPYIYAPPSAIRRNGSRDRENQPLAPPLIDVRQILDDIDAQVASAAGGEVGAEVAEIQAAVINEVNEVEETTLFIAAAMGFPDVVVELPKHSDKESVVRKNRLGYDAFNIAARKGHHVQVTKTKQSEQQRESISIRHVETLKQKIMKLRKENESLKRHLVNSEP